MGGNGDRPPMDGNGDRPPMDGNRERPPPRDGQQGGDSEDGRRPPPGDINTMGPPDWSSCYANCTNPVLGCDGEGDNEKDNGGEVDDDTSSGNAQLVCLWSLVMSFVAMLL